MTTRININCDLGEGMGNDLLIIPHIHSANIACGYHAGDVETMRQTIEACLKHGVLIGAHPSFYDRENFGRSEMQLPADEIYDLVTQQLIIFSEVLNMFEATLHHVKPHGALYNQSAKDPVIAKAIASAAKDFDHNLVLYGLSGSHSIEEAKKIGLKTASEAFADRTYRDDGSLTPRSQHGALIDDVGKLVAQVSEMINEGMVTTVHGKKIPILAETICVHGDGSNAVEFVRSIGKL
jgi:UPF0271 protein